MECFGHHGSRIFPQNAEDLQRDKSGSGSEKLYSGYGVENVNSLSLFCAWCDWGMAVRKERTQTKMRWILSFIVLWNNRIKYGNRERFFDLKSFFPILMIAG